MLNFGLRFDENEQADFHFLPLFILGITANKEILRLLIQYRWNSSLFEKVLYPFWLSKPHQDVRLCLVQILLRYIETNFENEKLWTIFEQAAVDEYIEVIASLVGVSLTERKYNRRGRYRLSTGSSLPIRFNSHRKIYVERVQMKVLDHPTSLESRRIAWTSIMYQYLDDPSVLLTKAKDLCLTLNKDGKSLSSSAFEQMINCIVLNPTEQNSKYVFDLFDELMTDVKLQRFNQRNNAVDSNSDLSVYQRVKALFEQLTKRLSELESINLQLKSLAIAVLSYEKTLAVTVGLYLLKLTRSTDELIEVATILREQLQDDQAYLNYTIQKLSSHINISPLYQTLSQDEKLLLCDQLKSDEMTALLIFPYFTAELLPQSSIDFGKCGELLKFFRSSKNLILKHLAMETRCTWIVLGRVKKETEEKEIEEEEEEEEESDDSRVETAQPTDHLKHSIELAGLRVDGFQLWMMVVRWFLMLVVVGLVVGIGLWVLNKNNR